MLGLGLEQVDRDASSRRNRMRTIGFARVDNFERGCWNTSAGAALGDVVSAVIARLTTGITNKIEMETNFNNGN